MRNDRSLIEYNEDLFLKDLVVPIVEERLKLFEQFEGKEQHCFSWRFKRKERKLMNQFSKRNTNRHKPKIVVALVAALVVLLSVPVVAGGKALITRLGFIRNTNSIYSVELEMLEDKQPDELPKAPTTIPYGFVLAEETYEENGYMLQKYTREGFAHIDFCRIPCNYTSYQKYYGSIDENGKIEFVHEIEDAQTVIIGEYQGIIYTAIRSYPYTKIAEIEWSDGTYYYKIRSAIDHYYTVFHCMPNKLDDLVSMARNVQ